MAEPTSLDTCWGPLSIQWGDFLFWGDGGGGFFFFFRNETKPPPTPQRPPPVKVLSHHLLAVTAGRWPAFWSINKHTVNHVHCGVKGKPKLSPRVCTILIQMLCTWWSVCMHDTRPIPDRRFQAEEAVARRERFRKTSLVRKWLKKSLCLPFMLWCWGVR